MENAAAVRGAEARGRAVYWTVWALLALPLIVDVWIGYFRHAHDEAARQWMNVDLGLWAVRIFLVGLSLAPVSRLLREPGLIRYRKTVSLFAFAYAMVHSVDYIFYSHAWAFTLRVWERRTYLMFGIAASLMMIPLAVTSIHAVRRRMGPKRWKALHTAVYAVALLTMMHILLWIDRSAFAEEAVYCVLLVGLVGLRLPRFMPAAPARESAA